MKVDLALVDHIAQLARLELSPEEKQAYLKELARILDYVEKLGDLDTSKVEPLVYPFELSNVFRPDAPGVSLPQKELLRSAPDPAEPFFRVPRVIEEG